MIYGITLNDYHNIEKYIIEAHKLKCSALQVFLGNKTLTTLSEKYKPSIEEIKHIKELLKKYKIELYCHAILTLNYCNDPNSKRNLWGLTNLIYDMNLLHKLGGKACVIHTGHYKTKKIDITKVECYHNFIESLKYILDNTKKVNIYIETPAHEKNTICSTIEELSELYSKIPFDYKKRVKICIDTCHIFVSGYNISIKKGVIDYFTKFDKLIGFKNIGLIHLNDSKGILNSHLDRHASIGEGYIFKDTKEGLIEIIKIADKYKITLILETPSEYFSDNITIITNLNKSIISNNNQFGGVKKSKKEVIIKIFKDLQEYYETIANKNKTTTFKIESYKKVIKQLELLDINKNILSINNLKNIPDIGQKSKDKIKIILNTNKLPQHNEIKGNIGKIKLSKKLQKIFGIGPESAKKLIYNDKVKSIFDLKEKVLSKKIELTHQQQLGLKYYKNLNKRISHDEITYITTIVKSLLPKHLQLKTYNAGSYKMGKEISGDIDLIITYNSIISGKNQNKEQEIKQETINNNIYKLLKKNKLIYETLSKGKEKSTYIIKIPNKYNKFTPHKYHQLDLAIINQKYLYFYLLYFSSSRDFSKKIRNIASKKGYKLNEKGLYYKKSGIKINFEPKSEKDIFDYLDIKYVNHTDRS